MGGTGAVAVLYAVSLMCMFDLMDQERTAAAVRVGVRFQPHWEPERLPSFAREVERLGYDELWFSEDCFWAGGVAMLATALASTERLTAGIGLLPAATRNPVTTAMELGALARIAPGRLVAAFGHGIPEWMDQIGATVPDRFAALEETVLAVRAILAGEERTQAGAHVCTRGVQLGFPPAEPPPILIGSTGPRGLRLAGRIADGAVLPELSCAAAVEWAREQGTAGGTPGRTVVFTLLSIDDDRGAALTAVRPEVERWALSGVFPRLAELAGIPRGATGPLDDETLRSIAAIGDPHDCAAALRGWAEAGAATVVLLPRAPDGEQQVRRFAADVLPLLRSA